MGPSGTGTPTGSEPGANATRAPHRVAVHVSFTTPGTSGPYAGLDGYACDPAQAGVCSVYGHEAIIPDDASLFNGTFIDTGYLHGSPALTERQVGNGTWKFTGSIVGCKGSGWFTMPYGLVLDGATPAGAPGGTMGFHGHDYLGKPIAANGTLHVSDASIDAEYVLDPPALSGTGTMTGYLVCD